VNTPWHAPHFQFRIKGASIVLNTKDEVMEPQKTDKKSEKAIINEKEAGSREDWEGGASRPVDENVPAVVAPVESPAKDLQRQADSVPKTAHGDNGPPRNLQSLPTQNTHEIDTETEALNKAKK